METAQYIHKLTFVWSLHNPDSLPYDFTVPAVLAPPSPSPSPNWSCKPASTTWVSRAWQSWGHGWVVHGGSAGCLLERNNQATYCFDEHPCLYTTFGPVSNNLMSDFHPVFLKCQTQSQDCSYAKTEIEIDFILKLCTDYTALDSWTKQNNIKDCSSIKYSCI